MSTGARASIPVVAGADSWTVLDIKDKGVPYTQGKVVISPDGDGTTDELEMRAFTTRQFEYEQGENYDSTVGNTSGKLKTSIQLTVGGLVMKTGGSAVFYDMQREFSDGEEADSVDDWAGIGADGVKGYSGLDATKQITDDHVADLTKLGVDSTKASNGQLTSEQATALNNASNDNCWSGGVDALTGRMTT